MLATSLVGILLLAQADSKPKHNSPNWGTYWTFVSDTVLIRSSKFPMPLRFEQAVISLLAKALAPSFGVTPNGLIMEFAAQGMMDIAAAYMPEDDVAFDPALVRTPSRRWPFTSSGSIT